MLQFYEKNYLYDNIYFMKGNTIKRIMMDM